MSRFSKMLTALVVAIGFVAIPSLAIAKSSAAHKKTSKTAIMSFANQDNLR